MLGKIFSLEADNFNQLLGGDGNDIILGGKGINDLFGGTGSDYLIGGEDEDLLTGSGPATAEEIETFLTGGPNGSPNVNNFDDEEKDHLNGGFGYDYYLVAQSQHYHDTVYHWSQGGTNYSAADVVIEWFPTSQTTIDFKIKKGFDQSISDRLDVISDVDGKGDLTAVQSFLSQGSNIRYEVRWEEFSNKEYVIVDAEHSNIFIDNRYASSNIRDGQPYHKGNMAYYQDGDLYLFSFARVLAGSHDGGDGNVGYFARFIIEDFVSGDFGIKAPVSGQGTEQGENVELAPRPADSQNGGPASEGALYAAFGGNDTVAGTAYGDRVRAGEGDDTVTGESGDDAIFGEGGNDQLHGDAGQDYLSGGNGDDSLNGGSGDDRMLGDMGNDTLVDFGGNDTYEYAFGDGNDQISDSGLINETDRLVLRNINNDDIALSRVGVGQRDLQILILSTGETIVVSNQFTDNTDSGINQGIEKLVIQSPNLDKDTTYSAAEIYAATGGTPNAAPTVVQSISDQSAPEDTAWTFTVPADSFSDADGDTLTYSATLADGSALPAWIGFDADTRTFSGTPPQDFNGTLSLKVIASDGTASASDVFDLVIAPENDAPVLATDITGQSGTEDTAWSFTVPADAFTDVDGDALTYSAALADGSDLPGWLSFDATTRTFSGIPPQGTAGTLSLKVIASDGTLSAEDLFDLSIEAAAPSTTINVITGTDGKETLEGTDGDDILRAGGENDWLENSKGNDVLLGGDGYDQARFEGAASDYVFRWNKDGSFTATSAEYGVDTLHSINGIWFRGEGKWYRTEDLLPQHSSFKTFAGTDSYEFIYASHGDDIVVAGGHNDTIQPLAGNDILFGGAGTDHLHLEGARADYEFQWNPDGTIYVIHATDGVKVLNGMEDVTFRGTGEWSTLDNLYVDPDSRTVVDGTSGNDTLAGTDFADVVEAGDGDDVIEGSAGDDTIFGGAGNDQVTYGGSAADVTVTENQDGTYTITSAAFGTDLLSGIETLHFSGENASYQLSAQVSVTGGTSNLIEGTDGKETLEGTDGDDILRAGGENDWIRNSKGNDVLLGGDGYDQARFAGAASDYVFRWNKDGSFTATSAEYGVDTLYSINGIWFSGEGKWYRTEDLLPQHSSFKTFAGTDSYEFIYASHGDDIVVAGAGNDTIQPLGGNDILFGGAGTDHLHLEGARADYEFQWNPDGTIYVIHATDGVKILNGMEDVTFRGTGEWSTLEALYTDPDSRTVMVGTSGNDTLTGTNLVDVIEAGGGDDVINGGAGGDVLFGEAGSDTFVFQAGVTGHDTVGDFVAGAGTEDVLQFASSVFTDADAVLAAADTVGGNTVITVDGDTSITLLNVTKADLHQDDFAFV